MMINHIKQGYVKTHVRTDLSMLDVFINRLSDWIVFPMFHSKDGEGDTKL